MKTRLASIHTPLLFLGFALCFTLAGCDRRSTPPGPSSSFGMVEPNNHFQFFIWEEGLVILLIDNITKAHQSSGKSSTRDPMHRQTGWAESIEGNRYDWKFETADGRTAKLEIDRNNYDVEKGTVFVIAVNEEETIVEQIDIDLSKLSNVEDCRAFIKANRDVLMIDDKNAVEK